ncbi:MAG TPA: S-methyl-5'-thioadenosine phosphorylase [Bacillota bacterium]|nr:S-methyl-5'-thioadenosine phosphorylase [Bacillota bacterium]HOJ84779.1 S-methyl-5'-thioadenosine phosphorylase [Bacillota bacterium]HOL15854.1 S-methyl-5'-thioadenosine phosphorylase [Bacillota bacterium]HPZ11938.1 S-methyl-5'-thioadenosine phosphorylase [Bacillota bacterium]HQE10183.1 S-methyl-5'-thioadenosine phosphorylase [Bacillota bacterium]
MKRVKIAIIGGTGVYDNPFLEEARELVVETGYGKVLFCRGYYKNREIYFLARHGPGHAVPPHLVNYRANIAALKKLQVDAAISTAAAGSMRRGMPPGSRVVIDQFIDFTKSRPATFYEGGGAGVVHVDLTEPYCPEIRRAITRAGRLLEKPLIDGGCYVCTEGPRFETPAEIRMFAQWGADLVGMTNVPEVVLAREAGLCYATIALVSNYAAGITAAPLSHEEVLEEMARSKESLDRLLLEAAAEIAADRSCRCSFGAGPWPPGPEANVHDA